jgi:nucleoside-diphosphate-sugar epimerase
MDFPNQLSGQLSGVEGNKEERYLLSANGDERTALPYAHVLVTGGAGFVGSHVCNALLRRGCKVTIFDAFLDFVQAKPLSSYVDLDRAGAAGRDRICVLRNDLRDRGAVREALERSRPDGIVHLAALPLVTVARHAPRLAVAINVDGTRNLLEEMVVPGTVRRLLFLSSSTVYGEFLYRPADEDHPTNPVDIYGRTKLIGEQLTQLYCPALGIDYVIIRSTAVYGSGDRNRRVVQLFIEQALSGGSLTVDDDGSEHLDFTYVKDLAAGIVLALFEEGARNNTFNLSRGEERSILELATVIQHLIPGAGIVHRSVRHSRPSRGTLNIAKARSVLGYRPCFSLEDGIADYLSLLKPQLKEAR